ncbi:MULTISPECIES: two-component system histidine kinase PnpS [unclassified Jeotgalibaca]|uniref:two-component system histidine kinase PnpS n=1 Tax=unclassified Jeotgalibaca TaxID=2621505 RepID=UPI003FD34DFC
MRKFTNQFMAIFIGLFLLLSMGVVFYTNQLVYRVTSETMTAEVVRHGETLAEIMERGFLSEAKNVQTAVTHLDSLQFFLEEEDDIAFINNSGKLIYSSNAYYSSVENQANTREIRRVIEGADRGTSGIVKNTAGNSEFRVAVPLFNGNEEQVGILRLTHELRDLDGLKNALIRSVFVFSFVAILMAGFIAYYLSNRISKPLKGISNVIEGISDGDYSNHYIGIDYPEVAELGDTVNQLAENLESKNREIIQSNERLTVLVDRLVIGVVLLDHRQQIQMMNPAAHEILGIDDRLLGHTFLEMTKSYGLVQIIQQTYQDHQNKHEEIYIYHPQDRILDVNTMIVPNIMGQQIIVLLYDITQIRRLEKVRTDFVSNASHELRTPVTALKGFAEVLLDGAMEDPVTTKQFLEIIYKESKRLEILVNDILELSRVEQKQVPMKQEEINLEEVVRACFRVIQPQADVKKIKLRFYSSEPNVIMLQTDRSRLEQVLNNLIINAVNYTDTGGKVSVMIEQTEKEAVIHVADTGIGIPEEDMGRIFERFYRVDKARSRNSGGTGLGLSIVRYLVQNLNGRISVKSTLGIGTTFTVHLPIK